jgi:hypothetical protein
VLTGGDQYESVRSEDFSTRGGRDRISPETLKELAGTGLLKNWLTVKPVTA